jgi:hypothetical protein
MQAEAQQEFDVVEEIPDQSYEAFLHSKAWAEIRHRVLERAGHVCEACGRRPAIIVHHLTMRYGFKPPLWCLKAVCRHCLARFRPGIRKDDWKERSPGFHGTFR